MFLENQVQCTQYVAAGLFKSNWLAQSINYDIMNCDTMQSNFIDSQKKINVTKVN